MRFLLINENLACKGASFDPNAGWHSMSGTPAVNNAYIRYLLGIDGENWWSASGLANWHDPASAGYDPANRHNVEWTLSQS